jgi:putative ATP-dependent endonuclease of OLD family
MYLGGLTISRFRSCDNVTVSLRPDLTVLVGENNGGKSNVVDAIRLLTLPLSGRRERYPEDEDVRRHATVPNFQIEGHGPSARRVARLRFGRGASTTTSRRPAPLN